MNTERGLIAVDMRHESMTDNGGPVIHDIVENTRELSKDGCDSGTPPYALGSLGSAHNSVNNDTAFSTAQRAREQQCIDMSE